VTLPATAQACPHPLRLPAALAALREADADLVMGVADGVVVPLGPPAERSPALGVGEPVPPLVEGPQCGAAIGALADDLEQLAEHGKLRAQGAGVAEVRAQSDGAPAHELHVAASHGLAPGLP